MWWLWGRVWSSQSFLNPAAPLLSLTCVTVVLVVVVCSLSRASACCFRLGVVPIPLTVRACSPFSQCGCIPRFLWCGRVPHGRVPHLSLQCCHGLFHPLHGGSHQFHWIPLHDARRGLERLHPPLLAGFSGVFPASGFRSIVAGFVICIPGV